MTPGNQTSLNPEQLAKQLAELAKFPEMNPGPVLRLDRQGIILLANEAARNLFPGLSLVGQQWRLLCPGLTQELWDSILTAKEPPPLESVFDGRTISFTHVRPEGLEQIFIYGSDITQRRRAEELLAQQARFPEMNPGPVLRTTLDGNVVLANAAARNVFGNELVGKSWLDICPGISKKLWDQILASTEITAHEIRHQTRDYVFAHRRDFQGSLVFVYGADITMQKTAERALHQSEKMATLGTLAAGVAHELNNPAAAARRAAEQLRVAFERYAPALRSLCEIQLNDADRNQVARLEAAIKDTSVHPGESNAMELADREASVESWLEKRGIEEGWELAPSLVAQGISEQRLTELSASASSNVVEAIVRWAARAYPVFSLLNEIKQGTSRISEIVGALKGYSYLGQAPIQSVNVHEGIDNTLIILRSKLKEGITVHRDYGSHVPSIMAYGSELNQVWTNLLDNAADAMNGKGQITIRTRSEGNEVVVEIEDDGVGIPPEIQSNIFDPFFTTKEPGKGTGLGLSTSYGIVKEKHHGTISVNSVPGKTLFTVRLPIAEQ
jgi:signal transduction histidine kinase